MYQSTIRGGKLRTSEFKSNCASVSSPRWLKDFDRLPQIYHDVIERTTTCDGLDSNLVYKIFLSSGLPIHVLRHIWLIASQSRPGRLTTSELVIALALIGHVQSNWKSGTHLVPSLEVLHNLHAPPIPKLSIPAVCSFPSPVSPSSGIAMTGQNGSSSIVAEFAEEEWADFTSFEIQVPAFSAPADREIDVDSSLFPAPGSSHPDEEEFGDFQKSHAVASLTSEPSATSAPVPSVPNYFLSSDLESIQSPSDLIIQEWSRCLSCATQILRDSVEVLSHLNSKSDRTAFLKLEEGRGFLLDLAELFALVSRIRTSAIRLALLTHSLESMTDESFRSFSHLSQYSSGDVTLETLWADLTSAFVSMNAATLLPRPVVPTTAVCGVCLVVLTDDPSTQIVPLAGRRYHLPCANFWINRIQISLPALALP